MADVRQSSGVLGGSGSVTENPLGGNISPASNDSRQQRKRPPDDELENRPQAPAAPSLQSKPYKRVCITCRRRKVRCDKEQPCQNCTKADIECVYPSRAHASRSSAVDTELLQELKRLEPMFKSLVSTMGESLPQINFRGASQNAIIEASESTTIQELVAPAKAITNPLPPLPTPVPSAELPMLEASPMSNYSATGSDGSQWNPYGYTTGKLVRDKGRNRYVGGSFWDILHQQTSDDDDADEDDDLSSDSGGGEVANDTIIDDRTCPSRPESLIGHNGGHPPTQYRLKAWEIFRVNVHPLVRVLHLPTIEPTFLEALGNHDKEFPVSLRPLAFVVYYGAVTSISEGECISTFGEKTSILLDRYKRLIWPSFERAKLLNTDELVVLQAFILYLAVLRRNDPTLSWTLTGLAIRLAQARGMHRDGRLLRLPVFEAEMRRRLWWNICLLDTPSSEDHSCAPTTLEISSFDAEMPCNTDDENLWPGMEKEPESQAGPTDMWLTVARCRLTDVWRDLVDARRVIQPLGKSYAQMTRAEQRCWLDSKQVLIQQQFINVKDDSPHHLLWVTQTIIKTLLCNLRLFILNPLDHQQNLPDDENKAAFLNAIACLEHSYSLKTDSRSKPWHWLVTSYSEWFAFAVVLFELSARPIGPYVNRAWRTVEQNVVLRWDSATDHRRTHQWRAVTKLLEKAKERKRDELKRRQSISKQNNSTKTVPTTSNAGQSTSGVVGPEFRAPAVQNLGWGTGPTMMLPTSSYNPDSSSLEQDFDALEDFDMANLDSSILALTPFEHDMYLQPHGAIH